MVAHKDKRILLFHPSWALRQFVTATLANYQIIDLFAQPQDFSILLQTKPRLMIVGAGKECKELPNHYNYLNQYAKYYDLPIIFLVNDSASQISFKGWHAGIKIWIYRNNSFNCLNEAVRLFASNAGV